ncbi:MAG: NADH-quinone oxidoreductase subunit C [Desulfurococcus sp.]|nr:NADH-quinone oxidoreductase subunit C [Desulfurococcus sp.]
MTQKLLGVNGRKIVFTEIKPHRLEARITDPRAMPEAVKSLVEAYSGDMYISAITAIDLPEENYIELDYIFYVIPEKTIAVLKTRVPRSDPRIPSITSILPGASAYEKEVFDLMGVVFEGNQDLRRIFTPPDIAGYPLRKDWKEGQGSCPL